MKQIPKEKMLEVAANAIQVAYALRGQEDGDQKQRLACLLLNGHLCGGSKTMRKAGFGLVLLLFALTIAQPALALEHRVTSGDTLWGLSQRYGTTVNSIKTANGLFSDMIYVGQRLTIPAYVPVKQSGGYIQFADSAFRYQVRAGDTLWGIARQYRVSAYDIKTVNGLKGNTIWVGQWLTIPGTP